MGKTLKNRFTPLLNLRLASDLAIINSKLLKSSLTFTIWIKKLILVGSLEWLLFESWTFAKILEGALFIYFSIFLISLILIYFDINKINIEALPYLLVLLIIWIIKSKDINISY